MSGSVLAGVTWWELLLERCWRQALQTAVPIIGAVVASGGAVDVRTVAVGLAGAVAVSVGKALLMALVEVDVDDAEAGLGWRILDRALPAAAGVVVGLWPVSAAELTVIDWHAGLQAAGAAAVLAVLSMWATPPTLVGPRMLTVRRSDLGDQGAVRARLLAVVMVVLALVGLVVLAVGPADAVQRPVREVPTRIVPLHPRVTSACWRPGGGVVRVRYSSETLMDGGMSPNLRLATDEASTVLKGSTTATAAWTFAKPDGSAVVELHHVGARAGRGGSWDPVPLRRVLHHTTEIDVQLSGEPTWDKIRVTVASPGSGRVASSGVLVATRCAA